jgi:1-deoxy-D-xylulose-5-phosphate synthase
MLERDGVSAAVMDARFVKPLDAEKILPLARSAGRVVTVEEHVLMGGFGSAVLEALADAGMTDVAVARVGVRDTFVTHGPQKILRARYGVDAAAVVRAARNLMGNRPVQATPARHVAG